MKTETGSQTATKTETAQAAAFDLREVASKPVTERVALCRDRYLSSPCHLDPEYLIHYTKRHREVSHWEAQERAAECHAYALERLTPVIWDGEIIVGNKTRFMRGGIPYANFSAQGLFDSVSSNETPKQTATGGAVAIAYEVAAKGEHDIILSRYLLEKKDKPALHDALEYWLDKCMEAETVKMAKDYPNSEWFTKGAAHGLYTHIMMDAPDGRYVLDFETILHQGLNSLIRRCEENIARTMAAPGTIEETSKVHFWRGAIRVLQATIDWARAYGRLATEMAGKEKDAKRRKELETIAAHCQSFGEPPKGFWEACQHFFFAFLGGVLDGPVVGCSVGRFDQWMYPFYQRDIEAGKIDETSVLELLGLLRVKLTETEAIMSEGLQDMSGCNLFIGMNIGGYTTDGQSADNELSRLILRATIQTQTTQPSILLLWAPRLKDEFLMEAAECVKTGCGVPAFFNTDVWIKHALINFPDHNLEFFRQYACIGGCAEMMAEGSSVGTATCAITNCLKAFELALYGGTDPRTGDVFGERPLPTDYNSLLDAYRYFFEKLTRTLGEYFNIMWEVHSRTVPGIFNSACTRDCIGRGKAMDAGGALINNLGIKSSAMVNVVNSLAAVRELLDKKLCDLDELRKALKANWKGYEALHKACLDAPKWGNDDDRVDLIFAHLLHDHTNICRKTPNCIDGKPYQNYLMGVTTPVCFGMACNATPDGRVHYESSGDGNTSPVPGTDTKGVMAVLRSNQKLDQYHSPSGLHNMKFLPSVLKGHKGSASLINMIKTHFETQTALQIQFNVVDSNMLRDAQAHPDNYRDLIVRFAGFSTLFVEMSKGAQDQVIERTEEQM